MIKRIPAFTLMEVMIAMTLTSLLLVATLYAYELIQKQYLLQKQMNEELTTYIQFETRLKQDVEKAKILERNQNSLICKEGSWSVIYDLQKDFVTRKDSRAIHIDTFLVKTMLAQSTFSSNPRDNGLLDYCELSIHPFEEERKITLIKYYGSSVYLNQ